MLLFYHKIGHYFAYAIISNYHKTVPYLAVAYVHISVYTYDHYVGQGSKTCHRTNRSNYCTQYPSMFKPYLSFNYTYNKSLSSGNREQRSIRRHAPNFSMIKVFLASRLAIIVEK